MARKAKSRKVKSRKAKFGGTLKDVKKLKEFVIAERKWQKRMTDRLSLLLKRSGLPGSPPPPRAPFK